MRTMNFFIKDAKFAKAYAEANGGVVQGPKKLFVNNLHQETERFFGIQVPENIFRDKAMLEKAEGSWAVIDKSLTYFEFSDGTIVYTPKPTPTRDELVNSLRNAMSAVHSKWGDVKTPFGNFYKADNQFVIHIDTWQQTRVYTSQNNWVSNGNGEAGIDDILSASQQIASIAQWLASDDFVHKVAGSIGTLKAIAKAIQ